MKLDNRLKKLEGISENTSLEILKLIKSGAYYDELTDNQRDDYCRYLNTDRCSFEEVHLMVIQTLHVKLEDRPKPPTSEELKQRIEEVEAYLLSEGVL